MFTGRLRSGQHDCSICLSETILALETNCGHVFCGECIFTYYSMANSGTNVSEAWPSPELQPGESKLLLHACYEMTISPLRLPDFLLLNNLHRKINFVIKKSSD